jgi:hypothetical protein
MKPAIDTRWTPFEGTAGDEWLADISELRRDPSDPWGQPLNHTTMERVYQDGELIEWRGSARVDGETVALRIIND